MGIKNMVKKAGTKAGNTVARLSSLSPEQLQDVQKKREKYLNEMPDPSDPQAEELTRRLLAANSVEIYNAYLPQLKDLYLPVQKNAEYEEPFSPVHNIRYFNITKWVTDKKENSLVKLVNVYEVLSSEECNIALIFHRGRKGTETYLAVTNTKNAQDNQDVNTYRKRLGAAIRGNFPGAAYKDTDGIGIVPCLNDDRPYSVAAATNIPTEKSEKFISQTIEKLLDGVVPESLDEEYTLILLATPIQDIEARKLRLSEFYTGLAPYMEWSTQFSYQESESTGATATVGVNVGTSAGVQHGQNSSVTDSKGLSDSESDTENVTRSRQKTHGKNKSATGTVGMGKHISAGTKIGPLNIGTETDITSSVSTTGGTSSSTAKSIAKSIGKTLGRTVSRTASTTFGLSRAVNFGINFGANFARSSSVTAVIGKNESITQQYTNYNIKHTLELLEEQMKRYEQSTALGMWDFAAYVLSENYNVASNVAHSYLALTQGEKSYMSQKAVNVWRGDRGKRSRDAEEICGYLRQLRHPIFGLNPEVIDIDESFNVYPPVVTATAALTGKELAYSLNFPQRSISGLPVLECVAFGRNVVTYGEEKPGTKKIELGQIFHMNHIEKTSVKLSLESLRSHTFITGSTGSGKSNTIYRMLDSARTNNVNFLVIEPAKGEYKNVFGMDEDVYVYGTNPQVMPLLRINPFSFPDEVHILEHLDRLVEIFNVCWPMYAAMPAVLKSAVERSYIECGWDLMTSSNRYDVSIYPDFSDVARNIKTIIDNSEYDDENKGAYKGSLLTRLQSLTTGINGLIFQADEISYEQLFERNVIIDLSRIGSSETKSLLMGMLVLKLQEFRMIENIPMNSSLRHLTVLEEAHNLLRRTSVEQSSESSNILGKSVELIANAIAEMRTYGEGFIIADQAPGLMDMSVIRNTNTKIIMRLPDQGDRELVGKSADLNEDQIVELAKLPCGAAAVYQNEWIQPVLCKVKRYVHDPLPFAFNKEENAVLMQKKDELSESLLKSIMDRELFRIGDREDLRELKNVIIRSGLNSLIKTDFLDYLDSEKENGLDSLQVLLYDLVNAKDAICASKQYDEIHEWVNSVLNKLKPSIKDYSKKQIDLAMALILHEQTLRDASYRDIYLSFTEEYQKGCGVF